MLLLLWQVSVLTRDAALAQLESGSRQQLNLYIAGLKGQLEKYEFLPELLSTNTRLVQLLMNPGDPQRIEGLNRYLETINEIAHASDTYLMDADGLTIAASNWQSERPFVGRNFSYRPYFKEAMKGNLGRYFALGTTSNKRGYYFAYPVRYEGRILGAVVVKMNMAEMEESWSGSGYEFIVTDPDGVIFITTHPNWRFRTLGPLDAEVKQRIIDSKRYQDGALTPIEGRFESLGEDLSILISYADEGGRYLVLDQAMPSAGWRIHVLARMDGVNSQVWRAILIALALFGMLLLLLVVLQQRRRRRLDRARFELKVKRNLEANEAKIRAILENTQAGLVLMNASAVIEMANSKSYELFGYSTGELGGESFLGCFPEREREEIQSLLMGDLEGVATVETTARRKGGASFPVELSIGVLQLSGESKRIATIHDIGYRVAQEEALRRAHDELEDRVEERTRDLTLSNIRLSREIEEHRRTEKVLRDTQEQLIQAAKLAALGQMSTSISHELNQPLAAIRSYADNGRALLQNGRKEDACWNMRQISELTERMAQISSQLKVFARKTTGQVVRVSLTAAVETSLQILGPRIKESETRIVNNLPEPELYVMGDMVQLEQVLVNLIGNAIQAMEALPERCIEIDAEIEADRLITRIRDTGPGIEEQNLLRIFDPFFTTKEEGRGLGLGLSISHRIVEGMNGELAAANDPRGGAVFTLRLLKG